MKDTFSDVEVEHLYLFQSRRRLNIRWGRNRRCRRRQRRRRRAATIRGCTDNRTAWTTAMIRFGRYHVRFGRSDGRCRRRCERGRLHLLGSCCWMGSCHTVGSIIFSIIIFRIEPNFLFFLKLAWVSSKTWSSQQRWNTSEQQQNS